MTHEQGWTHEVRSLSLSTWQRVGVGIPGMAMSILGTFAVFRSENGAGTVALLATGGVLLILGLVGLMPSRVVIAGTEIDLLRVIERALEGSEPEVRERVATAVLEESLDAAEVVTTNVNRVAASWAIDMIYAGEASSALRRVLPPNAEMTDQPLLSNGFRPDAMVVSGERKVAVEFRRGPVDDIRWGFLALRRIQDNDNFGILLVSSAVRTPLLQRTQNSVGLGIVVWEGPVDDDRLRKALHAALEV